MSYYLIIDINFNQPKSVLNEARFIHIVQAQESDQFQTRQEYSLH